MKILLLVIAVLFLLLAGLYIFETGVERQEKAECLKFQEYALEYPGFYLTTFEKEQCDALNIEVNAPVEMLPRM